MDDRLQAGEGGAVAEHPGAERGAVDGAVAHYPRKGLGDRRHGGPARRQQAVNGGVGVMNRQAQPP